ncbi:hypothetical protein [uncultured Brevundimonas sp.]|uniref:hypothetical protein n=1 Tax=uncultured Brevundimonas sp. TaxID=213418 RepID=UPI00260106CB|nr:hypothetical protein [uncultured Brevundimonas sp.]
MRDLFTEDGGGWLEDPALLDRMVGDKLTALADEARQREGWKWAEAASDYVAVNALGRVYPVEVVRSEDDAAQIAALSEEYDSIVSEAGPEGLTPEADARLEEIDKALQAFGPDFDYPAEVKARAGVMVLLGHDGLARFERGLVRGRGCGQRPGARSGRPGKLVRAGDAGRGGGAARAGRRGRRGTGAPVGTAGDRPHRPSDHGAARCGSGR